VFEPFVRLDGASSHAPGIGLGLATVTRLVEAYGGEVVLVDVLPGHSTTSLVNRAKGGRA